MHSMNKAYDQTVTSDASGPIDLSMGRVQLIDGDVFFSPNSRREVKRPWLYNGTPSRDSKRHQFSEFLEPLWWLPDCPYLPFVPLRPVYAGVPFQELFNMPLYFPRSRSGYIFDYKYVLGWAHVQKLLVDSTRRLLNHYNVPPVTWIASTAIGCTGAFVYARELRESVLNSRDWFSQWMAGLSYAIAISKSLENESLDDMWPAWFSFLCEQRFTQIWLSGIKSSLVATFTPSVDRVGVFLHLIHPHREQPSVDWFCRYQIPVWYPWGLKETESSLRDRRLARFAPLPFQLQEMGTFMTKSPQQPSIPQASSSTLQAPSSTHGYDCMSNFYVLISIPFTEFFLLGAASTVIIPSWKEFFENRRRRNEQRMARETNQQRQARESREKNPPTSRTKVFLWSRAEGGGYIRQSFFQSENGMHLDSYGKNQKIYDAFSNEWDCCYEFGQFMDDDIVGSDNDGDDEYPSMPPAPSATDAEIDSAVIVPPADVEERQFQIDVPSDVDFDWKDINPSDILYQFLGFIAPLPLPDIPSALNAVDKEFILSVVGLERDNTGFLESPLASFALAFLEKLKARSPPLNASWDIADGNRMSLVASPMFSRMRVLQHFDDNNRPRNWFLFDFMDQATMPWRIAVSNVIDALFICRLDIPGRGPLVDFEVALHLLNRGIQFCTLVALRSLPRYVGPPLTVPSRLFGYTFTIQDYYAYEQERAALLKNPRIARAALLRGGIVWRLAVTTMSFDDVLEGPSRAVTVHRQGNIFNTTDSSVSLCDDGLSRDEMDVICGLHYCQNGMFVLFHPYSFDLKRL